MSLQSSVTARDPSGGRVRAQQWAMGLLLAPAAVLGMPASASAQTPMCREGLPPVDARPIGSDSAVLVDTVTRVMRLQAAFGVSASTGSLRYCTTGAGVFVAVEVLDQRSLGVVAFLLGAHLQGAGGKGQDVSKFAVTPDRFAGCALARLGLPIDRIAEETAAILEIARVDPAGEPVDDAARFTEIAEGVASCR